MFKVQATDLVYLRCPISTITPEGVKLSVVLMTLLLRID